MSGSGMSGMFQPPCQSEDQQKVTVSMVLDEDAAKNVQGVLNALAQLLQIDMPIQYNLEHIETPPPTPERGKFRVICVWGFLVLEGSP